MNEIAQAVIDAAREFRDRGTVLTVCGRGPCIGLPVVSTEDPYFYSYWRTTWRERLAVLFGRPVRLCVASAEHPPVMIDTVKD